MAVNQVKERKDVLPKSCRSSEAKQEYLKKIVEEIMEIDASAPVTGRIYSARNPPVPRSSSGAQAD